VQASFNGFRMLRMAEMPRIEPKVECAPAPGGRLLSGCGEQPLALYNAMLAATGKRLHCLKNNNLRNA
jgi:CO/xanthine dehydrogenase Mo-binding subunit